MKFKKLYNLWYCDIPHNGFVDDSDTDTLCELISNYINPEIIEVDSTYHVFSCINDDDFGATYQRWFNDVIITDAARNS